MAERFTSVTDAHVIFRRDRRILLMRRAGGIYASGQLCLPSGHLEEGESIVAAAVREAREETGIILDPGGLRMVLAMHQRNPDRRHTRLGFFFEPGQWHGEPANQEPAKCSELIWADPDHLPADTVEYTAAAIRAIQQGHVFALNGWDHPCPYGTTSQSGNTNHSRRT